MRRLAALILVGLGVAGLPPTGAQETPANRPERLEWFRDLGFGLFIHWAHDSQLGSVISHSMVGADEDYLRRFVEELPKTFDPKRFAPREWAVLARLAGIRYVVFTTKHHSGFCMFDTRTTDFSIMNTPYGRDLTRELVDAFRAEGIAPGFYFSPDDFWWLWRNGIPIQRQIPAVQPAAHAGLMTHDRAQVRELLTQYGDIDVIFFDGEADGLRELAWQLQPGIVVTRGALETPEQTLPGIPLEGVWEGNVTMGTQWQYKPTNERYKSGGELIGWLVETRAKGGNLLLNVGPKPDGTLPIEQEERLREIALWMFINGEAIYAVRPWIVTNEGEVWFTKAKDGSALYAVVRAEGGWPYGQWREVVLRSVRATDRTEVSVLGQNDQVLEYRPEVIPKTTWEQRSDGLSVRAMRAQRIYNDRKWPNPVVLKLTDVEPALTPPRVVTLEPQWDAAQGVAVLAGELAHVSDAPAVEVGFEARDITGLDLTERPGAFETVWSESRERTGAFTARVSGWQPGRTYEVRAVVKHPVLTMYGREVRLTVP